MQPELDRYQVKLEDNNDNQNILVEYFPVFFSHICMLLCCSISGICAIFASTLDDAEWVIRLAKVAKFFSKTSFWLVAWIIFHNWDPMEWKTLVTLPEKWVTIEVSIPTWCYCFLGQKYFVSRYTEFINEKQNEVED